MTRAELAFSALDRNKKGYITAKDLGKLTKKLSKDEVAGLMGKLDTDGDGQLSFDEFKVLFENADKRKRECDRERKSGVHVAEPFIRRTSGSERVRQDTFLILKLSLVFTILEKFDSI